MTDYLIPNAGLYFCAFSLWRLLYSPKLQRHLWCILFCLHVLKWKLKWSGLWTLVWDQDLDFTVKQVNFHCNRYGHFIYYSGISMKQKQS